MADCSFDRLPVNHQQQVKYAGEHYRPVNFNDILTKIPTGTTKLTNTDNPKTLISATYQALRKDIIQGHLPPGSKLKAEHLKDTYNVGAGTLREALALLSSDSLVTFQSQRGYRVATMSQSDFEDITETRVVLECQALRISMQTGGDQWESSLIAAFHLLTRAEEHFQKDKQTIFEEWESANKLFHETLISHSNSIWIPHFLKILYSQAERYRRLLLPIRPDSRNVHKEHEEIFNAAIARNENTACSLLSNHIRYNLKLYQQLADKTK